MRRSASLFLRFEKLAPIMPLDFILFINAASVTERNVKFFMHLLLEIQTVSKAAFPYTIPLP
jgi:hypothetical protein